MNLSHDKSREDFLSHDKTAFMWHVTLSCDKLETSMANDVILYHLKARQLNRRRQHGSPRRSRFARPGFRSRDPGCLLQALLGLPIEINQRKIVSSPSEAFAPAAEKVAGGRTDPSPIKFSKFTILCFTAAYTARAPFSLGYFSSHFSEVFITLK